MYVCTNVSNCIPFTNVLGGGGGGEGYYGLVGVMRPPCQKTFLYEHDNLKNPERIAFIFYM